MKHMTDINTFSQLISTINANKSAMMQGVTEVKSSVFDPEMLYVECRLCGKPIIWEKGKTTFLLVSGGVDLQVLDESCMIVSEGCTNCRPHEIVGFTLAVVRLAGVASEEAFYMLRPGGNA